jgi:signal transduction histidine kinase
LPARTVERASREPRRERLRLGAPVTTLADNPLARAVARISTTLQRKLIVAFAMIVVLLVAVGAVGLGVLSESNSRVDALGQLPKQLAAFQQLEFDTNLLTTDLPSRSNLISFCFTPSHASECSESNTAAIVDLAEADGGITATLDLMDPLTDVAELGFVPPPDESSILRGIRADYVQISTGMQNLIVSDRAGRYFDNEPELTKGIDLLDSASQLVGITEAATTSLIAQNEASYLGSQHLFVGVAAASAVLALLLAFILARSVIGPIRKMDTQLAAIASGDFSGHVDVPNRDELGTLAANLNRMNDELGRLYREVEAASRNKSEFLANMSHELRTPLNAVIGFSDVLRDQMFGELNDKQMEYVTDIHTSGRHLLTLINDILDLSKIEAGRLELQVSSFSLPEVLQHSVALMRERATRQGIFLRLEVDPGIGVIDADERLVKQVLFNLLSNALKFTGRGGHIDVLARDDEDVAISVRDDGAGIAPADQARIFEEFEQAGKSTVQEGTGLGLALSRRFVELHGGRLSVQSTLGQGSIFMFNLPKTHSAGAERTEAETPPQVTAAPPS